MLCEHLRMVEFRCAVESVAFHPRCGDRWRIPNLSRHVQGGSCNREPHSDPAPHCEHCSLQCGRHHDVNLRLPLHNEQHSCSNWVEDGVSWRSSALVHRVLSSLAHGGTACGTRLVDERCAWCRSLWKFLAPCSALQIPGVGLCQSGVVPLQLLRLRSEFLQRADLHDHVWPSGRVEHAEARARRCICLVRECLLVVGHLFRFVA
mmetsp:Transcript_19623/g.52304  ORF Transcript_19623/g.52304 Transcript_19623/m.52304 type:complete len:205 (+) Transcript_19623:389-1003(+)